MTDHKRKANPVDISTLISLFEEGDSCFHFAMAADHYAVDPVYWPAPFKINSSSQKVSPGHHNPSRYRRPRAPGTAEQHTPRKQRSDMPTHRPGWSGVRRPSEVMPLPISFAMAESPLQKTAMANEVLFRLWEAMEDKGLAGSTVSDPRGAPAGHCISSPPLLWCSGTDNHEKTPATNVIPCPL